MFCNVFFCRNIYLSVRKYYITYDASFQTEPENASETVGVAYLCSFIVRSYLEMCIRDRLMPKQIPVALDGDSVINRKVSVAGGEHDITCVSMGNPHCIVFGDDPENLDLPTVGPKFEFDKLFPERVNTEFIQVIDKNTLKMRVWERGSGETLACGTVSCAAVVAAVLNGFCEYDSPVTVKLVGGELSIRYCKDGTVYMTGPAVIAFDGTVNV